MRTLLLSLLFISTLSGCNTLLTAGSIAKGVYTSNTETNEFQGIKRISANSFEEAFLQMPNMELYNSLPAIISQKKYVILLTGKDDKACFYSAAIPNNPEGFVDFDDIVHQKKCRDDVTRLKVSKEEFPASSADKKALMNAHIKTWSNGSVYTLHHEGGLHITEFVYSRNIASECIESVVSVVRGVRLVSHKPQKTCRPQIEAYLSQR